MRHITTQAADCLLQGGIIAYPTEGVWGLGCLPEDRAAVAGILKLKTRPWEQGLILIASRFKQILPYIAELNDVDVLTLKQTWPGPVTFLIPKSPATPTWISGDSRLVAIRVSAHPIIQMICDHLVRPIVSTSANPSSKPPALSSSQVKQYFPSGIDLVIPGALGGQKGACEIRSLCSGEVLRAAVT